jgi:phosphatidylglycerophosphate synthase
VGAGRLIPDRDEYFRRWSASHSGIAPNTLVRGWLSVCYFIARRLPVSPMVATIAGLLLACGVPALCVRPWFFPAAALVLLSGLCDGLDGALAVLHDRGSRFGAVVDSLADRFADTAYFLGLWLIGAPGWLAGSAAGAAFLQEYLRAYAHNRNGRIRRRAGYRRIRNRAARSIRASGALRAVMVGFRISGWWGWSIRVRRRICG